MIEAYEANQAPPFELYALGFEHKHVPEIAAFARLAAAPLFRPVGRKFPTRNAGLDSAPSRRAAGRPKAVDLEGALTRHYAAPSTCARFPRRRTRGWAPPR